MRFLRNVTRRTVLEVALIALVVVGIRAWQQRDVATGMAPPLTGTTLDGTAYSLATQFGEPVLVHFWATWCSICRLEQSSIDALAENHRVITVAMQSGTLPEVALHVQQHDLKFSVINDPNGAIAADWGVHVVPASFVVDPSGKIRFIEIGYTTQLGLRLRMWLAGW